MVSRNIREEGLLEAKEGRITLLEDALKSKEEEILLLKEQLSKKDLLTMKSSISPGEMPESQRIILKQRDEIRRFKGSIVYPLFCLTSYIGRTGIGHMIERLVKWK
ncbi:MAG: hypothetical protein HGA85_06785 [Nanoarchaeota archaeon]|nr:hypothetical protein [Nanoarchaeota archaeon]